MQAAVSPDRWCQNRFWLPAMMLLSTVGVWFTNLPPLTDLLGHMARYHVQMDIGHNPVLQKNWAFQWDLIGNLGVDLLIIPLSSIFGLERAVWIIALMLPPLFVWGLFRVAGAVHGQTTAATFVALPIALAYPYHFGFVNFCLASALALHGLASWISLRERGAGPVKIGLIFTPVTLIIWVCHLYGWALFAVLIGSYELSRIWVWSWRGLPLRVGQFMLVMVPMAPPAILLALWRRPDSEVLTTGFFKWSRKIGFLLSSFRDQSEWLDCLTLALVLLVIAIGFSVSAFRKNAALITATIMFLGFQIVLPIQLQGSAFADARLWPMTLAAALLAIGPGKTKLSSRVSSATAALAIVLFAVRMAVTAQGFAETSREIDRHLQALDKLPRGASIAVLIAQRCPYLWKERRIAHVSSLAIVRKDAFTNGQWAIAGGQMLSPLRARGTAFNSDPSQFVNQRHHCNLNAEAMVVDRVAKVPRDRFDWLWLFDIDPAQMPALDDAERVYADDTSALYRLVRR
jgi:hypothetical protein